MMNKQTTITIGGKSYPCRMTMGAMRRFKRITGKDVSELDGKASVDDLCTLMYSCTASACNADRIDFDFDEERFADSVDVSELNQFTMQMNDSPESKKKK